MKQIIISILVVAGAFAGGAVVGSRFGRMFKNHSAAPVESVAGGFLKLADARMAGRDFSTRPIEDKTMDEILWAAFGKNSRGTRTIPTAKNEQNLKVYAIRADGAFLYDGEKMNRAAAADLRPLFAKQGFVMDAPLTLLFVGSDREYSPMHAGSAYQNVALYAAEKGMINVVRGYFDRPAVERALGLSENEFAIVSQTIGFKK